MKKQRSKNLYSRRRFLRNSFGTVIAMPLIHDNFDPARSLLLSNYKQENDLSTMVNKKSIIGDYGQWAASLRKEPPAFSFRNSKWTKVDVWKEEALNKTKELLSRPVISNVPDVVIEKK